MFEKCLQTEHRFVRTKHLKTQDFSIAFSTRSFFKTFPGPGMTHFQFPELSMTFLKQYIDELCYQLSKNDDTQVIIKRI